MSATTVEGGYIVMAYKNLLSEFANAIDRVMEKHFVHGTEWMTMPPLELLDLLSMDVKLLRRELYRCSRTDANDLHMHKLALDIANRALMIAFLSNIQEEMK